VVDGAIAGNDTACRGDRSGARLQGLVEERKWYIFRSRCAPALSIAKVIRVQRSDGVAAGVTAQTGLAEMRRLWEEVTIYNVLRHRPTCS
jgi:hypothetical protein